MEVQSAIFILKFTFDKKCRRWSQIIGEYLKRNVETARVTWFASRESLIFCVESRSKTNRAVLTIPADIISNYQLNLANTNFNLRNTPGFIFSIKSDNMQSFLISTENDVSITVEPTKFSATYTYELGTNTLSSKLFEIDQSSNPLEQLQGTPQCQLTLSHTNNSILQSIYSICHNFRCKMVHLQFSDVDNTLILKFMTSEQDEPITIGTVIQQKQRYLKRPRKYNAKMFATGLLCLDKCESIDLCFSNNVILFFSKFKEGYTEKYYLTELADIGEGGD